MRKWFAALVFLIVLAFGGTALAETRHVVVLDQSGSMAPFFSHPRLTEFLQQVTGTDSVFGTKDHVTVVLFSQEGGSAAKSPQVLFTGSVTDLRKDWPAVSGKFKAVPQWTDLIHGLKAGVAEAGKAKGEGARIVWFLTDNVAEGAGAKERQDTVAFYQALKEAPEFQGFADIQVFPLDVQHPEVKTGLMLYAMLWVPPGTPADVAEQQVQTYRQVTANLAATKRPEFMGQLPLLVKPLDQSPFRLELLSFTKAGSTKPIPITSKNGKVVLPKGQFKEGEPIRGTLSGRLVSNYETFKVPAARLKASLSDPRTADFNPVKPGLQKIDQENLGELGARAASQPFTVRLELPPLAASWNMQSLLGTSGTVATDLKLTATLAQGLEIDTSRMSHLTFHAMTELPQLFAQDVRELPVEATLEIPVAYSGARFVVGVGALIAIIILVILALWGIYRFVNTKWEWTLTNPDGSEYFLIYRRWHKKEFVFWDGRVMGQLVCRAPDALLFKPDDGTEPVSLEDGGTFTITQDGQYLLFRVESRNPIDEAGGDDDVA
ncbi:MAG TPA: hypothetical protein VK464_18790 [Symbiobacteriaceae bacterium]|nr:hypothetical protein [Symbiobacteriaceae bacterium]